VIPKCHKITHLSPMLYSRLYPIANICVIQICTILTYISPKLCGRLFSIAPICILVTSTK
jgi:hypothetical protein